LYELRVLDHLEEKRALYDEENLRKDKVVSDLKMTTLLEEVSWKQKSRVLWLRKGGKCTKFFYQVANSNRRNNSIESLLINGTMSSNLTEIREHIV
jgi:hypothetical protein